MKLKALIKPIELFSDVYGSKEVEISGITSHSQAVAPGCLFIAKRGKKYDGNQYVSDVIRSGAHAILSDMYNPSLKGITQIIVPDVAQAEALIASQFYSHPSRELFMVGITGTSGKTTTSYLIRHLLLESGVPTGLIGTVAYIAGTSEIQASRTTPDVIFNHKIIRDMVRANDKACVMEVTSHALDQGRVFGIDFDVAVFTNLSHEHLDYHTSMEEYARVKKKLFLELGSGRKKHVMCVMNRQDPFFSFMSESCKAPICTYGIEDIEADLSAWNISFSTNCTSFEVSYKGTRYKAECGIPGRFNVSNILAALGVLLAKGIPLQRSIQGLKTFQGPPGRLERVTNSLKIPIFVDYAHKEDALRKVLPTLRECTKGRLITVFGCGGDRDREKRPLMAKAVEELSDIAIVTSDNPRSEDPMAIIREIEKGFQRSEYIIEPDRKKAIEKAVNMAAPGDAILIAGKGHEKEQIFHHTTIPFDDCQIAFKACEELYATRQK